MVSRFTLFCSLSVALVLADKYLVEEEFVSILFSLAVLLASLAVWRSRSEFEPPPTLVEEEDMPAPQPPILTAPEQPNEVPPFFALLHRIHSEDRPFQAIELLEKLHAEHPGEFVSISSPSVLSLISKIETQREEILRLTSFIEQEDKWKFRMKHKGVDVFLSTQDPRDFKVVCTATNSDLFHLISLIYETDLYKHWVPGVSQSGRWKKSTFDQELYLRFPLPFPATSRDVVLKGYGDVRNGGVTIYVASVDSPEAERKLQVKPGAIRVDVVCSGLLLRPKDEQGTIEVTLITKLDLKLPLLPDYVVDYAAKFVLCELLSLMRDMSRGMTAKPEDKKYKRWTDRQRGGDAAVYEEVRRRLAAI